jgi:CelD/BcsL family acetyltransferase involved in cellulose biosynthesis
VRDDAGRLQGLAPWFRRTEDDGRRIVRTIGCVDVTDYLDIIARRGHEQAVFEALASHVARHADQFDEIKLCNIPEESPALDLAPDVFRDHGFAVDVRLQEVCPVVLLPERWEDYVASLDKKNRHELRRKLRRAGGSAGGVEWYIVGSDHDLREQLACFLYLMAQSHPDKARFLQDPGNRAFFERVVPLLAERGWLQLAFLTLKGRAAAAYMNFDYGNRILVYNSGHDPHSHDESLSPGIVLLARLIEHAIQQRREAFDFLRGDEPYKYDLGGQNTSVYQMILRLAEDAARPSAA